MLQVYGKVHRLVLARRPSLICGLGIDGEQLLRERTTSAAWCSAVAVSNEAGAFGSLSGRLVATNRLRPIPLAICAWKVSATFSHTGGSYNVPDIVRFLPPSRSSSRGVSTLLSPEGADGVCSIVRGSLSPIRERKLPLWLSNSGELPFCPPPDVPEGACGGWSLFQSRSRPSPLRKLSPPVIARGADGVEGGNVLAEVGPSPGRLSPSYNRS